MKKLLLIASVIAVTLSSPAQAQFGGFGKIFGATKSNPGSVLPEWWNETDYNPPTQDGAMHIRVGSAGAASERYTQIGRANCDWTYLYAAKAGIALDPREKEECALLEFHIKRGVDGDKRNLADGFVKQEIVNEMGRLIDARIEQFRAQKLFYFRAAALKVEPYDFRMRSSLIKVNWTSTSTNSANYVLHGRGFSDGSGWMQLPLMADESTAREIEAARTNTANAYIGTPYNRIVFEVISARQASKERYPTRVLEVLFREVSFRVVDSNNQKRRISIENMQATPH